jgi:UDP-glucose 4-epimerase
MALKDTGASVLVVDNLSTGFRENLHYGDCVVLDLADRDRLNRCFHDFKPDAVLHIAGSIVVPESVRDPITYYYNNTMNSLNVIDACLNNRIGHFLFSSTAAVYGIPPEGICAESAPLCPINPYGHTKAMTERMLADTAEASSLRYVALRYFNVAGAHPSLQLGQRMPDATHLIKIIAQVITQKRASLSVFGTDYPTPDGTCIRDYIHVCDLADAHVRALDWLLSGGKSLTLNCGYSRGFSVNEVIKTAEDLYGPFPVTAADRRPGDPPQLIANADRIRSTLNWTPRYDGLSRIIQSAVEFEKSLL